MIVNRDIKNIGKLTFFFLHFVWGLYVLCCQDRDFMSGDFMPGDFLTGYHSLDIIWFC